MTRHIWPPATDCRTQIFHLEYQGQTRNTRILERKPLIDTSYRIRYRLELKFSLSKIFDQCSSSSSSTSKNLEKVRTDNLKIRTDLRDWVMDGWSVTKKMDVYKCRLLKKSSNRKSKLFLSTLVTTWLSNIAFHFQPIWLQILVAIDSESRLTSFPSSCTPPSDDALSSDRSSIQTCCFAQDSIRNMLLCS